MEQESVVTSFVDGIIFYTAYIKDTLLTLPPFLLTLAFVCLSILSVFQLRDIMFTLYGMLTSPWRTYKKSSVNKCDSCGTKTSRGFYRFVKCEHLFCYQCFKVAKIDRCNCPTCSTVIHAFCSICCGKQ